MTSTRPAISRGDRQKARTRGHLIDAARTIFTRDGFYESQIAAIPAEAGMATGTFYNYFNSKEEIFEAAMHEVVAELTGRTLPPEDSEQDFGPIESIRRANRAYLQGYRQNAQLMKICVFLADSNPGIGEIKQLMDSTFERRQVAAITRWQRQGLISADVDPRYTANALAYMVDRFAAELYLYGKSYDEDISVEVLTNIWAKALGIKGA